MVTVELKQLRKRYGDTEVLHGIDLAIKKGQFVVIVGPSGCGKSTLLRLIAGLDELSAGEVIINNNLVNELPPKQRDIAMVFQNYALYPHMTVFQNIAYGLKMRGFKRAVIQQRVTETARILHLEKVLQRKPKALSGGQRQRVAMGRAIVREPTLFLFDEPLSNLDASLRVSMRLEIAKLQKQLGITSIYVTHDQVEAMTLADQLVVMNEGAIEQVGKPLEVYQHPASSFVAHFIGSPAMNFFQAQVCDYGKTVTLPGEQTLPLPLALPIRYNDEAILVGIRPEALQIADFDDLYQMRVRVDMVEALGSDTIIYGRIADSQQSLVAKLMGNIRTHAGEFLTLSINPAQMHFFDQQTKRRILGI